MVTRLRRGALATYLEEGDGGERLSAADASNIYIDAVDQVNVFLLAGVLGPGGFVPDRGEPELDHLRADLATRLADDVALRRFSQRPGRPGHGGGGGRGGRRSGRALAWLPSPPDLTWHVRTAQPVAGREGLAALCAHLMTVPLPTDRPRWELLVVPGASPEGPGIVLRVHHAVADGALGVGLVQRLFGDPVGQGRAPVGPGSGAPTRALPGRTPAGGPWWRTLGTGLRRVTSMLRRTVPPTVLLGPISGRRELGVESVDLARLRARTRETGATVNDALLSAVAVGVAAGLREVGEEVPASVPTSVPVALPDRGGSGNAVGVMMVPLPTAEADGARRLEAIARITRDRRVAARGQGTFELTRTRWGSRLFAWFARRQRFIALFVTNVRGPDHVLRVGGAPLVEAWPVAQIQGNVRLGVAAMSYAGRLSCTVHADAAGVSAQVVAAALGAELTALAGAPGSGT